MKNIHLLPTENYSPLVHSTNKYGGYFKSAHYSPMKEMGYSYQHIYITNNEEIKEGDWILDNILVNKKPIRVTKELLEDGFLKEDKKIILTTNPDLISDGVQAIDDEFLEWFVKNPSCEEVEVKSYKLHFGSTLYKIIIPKEELKQETQGYICPQTKIQCDDECCVSAENCHIESSKGVLDDYANGLDYAAKWHKYNFIEGAKQQTLEEAAEILYPIKIESCMEGKIDVNSYERNLFIAGAKWQQERMYSGEEVLTLVDNLFHKYSSDFRVSAKIDTKEWFEQFKNK